MEGYLGGQGMDNLFNNKFTLVQCRTLNSETDPNQTSANNAQWDKNRYLRNSEICINIPDHKNLRERTIQLRHDAPLGGHGGQARTLEAVSRVLTCKAGKSHCKYERTKSSVRNYPLDGKRPWDKT